MQDKAEAFVSDKANDGQLAGSTASPTQEPLRDQHFEVFDYSPKPSDPGKESFKLPRIIPFFWLAWAATLGILAADALKLGWLPWLLLIGFGLAYAFLEGRRRPRLKREYHLSFGLVLAGFSLAALLYQLSLPPFDPQFLAYYNEKGDAEIEVLVTAPPEARDGGQNLTVRVLALRPLYIEAPDFDATQIRGKLLIQTQQEETFAYGNRLSLQAELQTPDEGTSFDYRAYLAHQGVYSIVRYAQVRKLASGEGNPLLGAIYALKARSHALLAAIFPPNEAALLQGVLLGDSRGLSQELKDAYALTGTAHIYAISGFNMAVLAALVTRALNRKRVNLKSALTTIAVLAFYTILVGASASVLRAAFMGAYALLGALIGRRGNMLNSLGLTVFLMLLFDPHLPWDLGFQLSAMATLGLVIFASPAAKWLEEKLQKRWGEELAARYLTPLNDYLVITLVAQLSVLPLLAFHFHQISPLFLIANPLILPVQPLVMVLGLLAMIGGLLSLNLGRLLAWPAWLLAAYTNKAVLTLASWMPGAARLPRFDFVWVLLAYSIPAFLLIDRKEKPLFSWLRPKFLLLLSGMATLLVWVFVAAAPDGALRVRVLPSDGLPNLLISSPRGRFVLVGGSGSVAGLAAALGEAMPPSHAELDWLVIPRCSRSEVSALFSLPEQMKLGNVLWLCDWERIQTTKQLFNRFSRAAIPQRRALSSDGLVLSPDAQLSFSFEEGSLASVQVRSGQYRIVYLPESADARLTAQIRIDPEKVSFGQATCESDCAGQGSAYSPLQLAAFRYLDLKLQAGLLYISGQPY